MYQLDHLADVARKAVRIGHELIKTARPETVTEKTDRDTFTDVDVRIEREIRAYLAEATPDIGFVGEEEGRSDRAANSAYLWGLDPIDGTANFVHGIPLCGISLALVRGAHTIVGAVSLPYLELHYSAVAGRGSFVNGKRLTASGTTELAKSIVAMGDYALGENAVEKNRQRIALTAELAAQVERVRMFGSAAHDLVWLAEGRVDAAIILSNKPLDLAAGILIAREAGVLVIDSTGSEHTSTSTHTIAVAPGISSKLLALVRSVMRMG
ncbi:inositol monophosphatase family protein [Lentzea flava]|uniref:Inositol monophosphatase n=1 Tax=Lentzea flava TaxID=103732 RepID=A0ABQ2UED6_9PSEU|nr:inositol monophosphatase family protein [Lentzea flava]MCP2198502.1 myo-inositol-1(or 4)-monophosphatase [Lentzea flava]GGU26315.1 inositol monophosphatase [Lentzea flava]